MKKYFSVFRIRFINGLQYRAVLFFTLAARFAWGFMEVLAYTALYRSGYAGASMEYSQTVSYMWMQQVLFVLFSVVFSDGDIYSAIGSGSIAYEMVRPMDLYGRWFCQSAANRVSFTLINALPVLVVACIIPQPYRMTLPVGAGQFGLFLVSMVLALGVTVAFAMLMYVSLFYTLSQRGVRIIVTAVTSFLSGGVIPLPFFPAQVLAVVELLPFAAMQNMPLRIYSGNIAGSSAVYGVLFQLFWLVVLVFLGRLWMGRAQKKVIVQGG